MKFCIINCDTLHIVARFANYTHAQQFLNTINKEIYTIQEL
jgi:hypothetical protein